ncbi:iron ABC transporter permease [Marinobacter lutaoensis]|jgi:iron complex transport system permease protein|uniref:FecCD family ABC transporter permease n=1 Tax=Marinobacter lutaoensis TaxID=135739 RepID=UPI00158D11B5|nr:iron ABC transporter permease [Marinobacter lutaoensis]NVD36526.1 iron ABC transporter permease [Marinobacter lutaoensis]
MTVSTTSPPPARSNTRITGHWWLRAGRWSLLINRRAVALNLVLLLVLAAVSLASLALGSLSIPLPEVIRALRGEGSPVTALVVTELRLPRLLAGWVTGAAFALAGVVMQTLARNRLATPGIIGIDNAATAFAVASVVGTGVSLAPPAMALTGAACATALAFGLAGATGTRGYRFIISGVAIGAVSGAITQVMLSAVPLDAANAAYPWTVGSLNARSPDALRLLAVGLGIGYLLALGLRRPMAILQLPEPVSTALGTRTGQVRLAGLALSVLLTGLAVAVAGPVGLVALIAPELARLASHPGRLPLTASALLGALLMTVSDLAGRLLLSPLEIPVGIITALAGSPYLLWLLLRQSPDINR